MNYVKFVTDMKLMFTKYQGTGNDFVMLDNLDGRYDSLSIKDISFLCDRKMGVGADGLIKISSADGYDFEVEYFNNRFDFYIFYNTIHDRT